jgi:hypothetical protein
VFHKEADYEAFVALFEPACERLRMRILAYCLMPNHFHLVLRPYGDGDLGRWMQWLMTPRPPLSPALAAADISGRRFKAFPIREDEHLLTVLRFMSGISAGQADAATRKVGWSSCARARLLTARRFSPPASAIAERLASAVHGRDRNRAGRPRRSIDRGTFGGSTGPSSPPGASASNPLFVPAAARETTK